MREIRPNFFAKYPPLNLAVENLYFNNIQNTTKIKQAVITFLSSLPPNCNNVIFFCTHALHFYLFIYIFIYFASVIKNCRLSMIFTVSLSLTD